MSTAVETLAIKGSSVPDRRGSPLAISAIVNYRVKDAIAFSYSVKNPFEYVENQGLEVIRRVCSEFEFFSRDEPCLISDSAIIGSCMKDLLQDKVELCGIQIIRMELMEVAYQPEVALSLLKVQQAMAKLDARELIVQGAV